MNTNTTIFSFSYNFSICCFFLYYYHYYYYY